MQKLNFKFLHGSYTYRKLKKINKLGTPVSQNKYIKRL